MAQVISTNIPSLTAQNNLRKSGDALAVSLERLSSGLRINSARDDAAGLAISTSLTSTIEGLSTAQRNANDAISLAQVAEGALQESTVSLLRVRELAVQSANGTNTASDRAALQAEANQLIQELNRTANTTTYNGLNILNGDLSNTAFQVGSEANQTISISIQNTQTTALGSNTVDCSNTNGISAAVRNELYYVTGTNVATAVGVAQNAATNGYAASTFTVSNYTTSGALSTQSVAITANESAKAIATGLSTLTGVSASGFNQVTISNLVTAGDSNFQLSLAGSQIDSGSATTISSIAKTINNSTNFSNIGIYAQVSGTSVTVYATEGHDLEFLTSANFATTANSFTAVGISGAGAAAVKVSAATTSATFGGTVDVALSEGYAASNSVANVFASGALSTTTAGLSTTGQNNGVGAQTINIVGGTGTTTVGVTAGQSAESIATAVNAVTGTTNVTATAQTVAQLSGLTATGTVQFNLFGDNLTSAAAISASVTTSDLTALVTAINNAAGTTNITAALGSDNSQILLTHTTGQDIRIEGFNHLSAVSYQTVTSTGLGNVDGSALSAPSVISMSVTDISNVNITTEAVTLYAGGRVGGRDNTVVGGDITFASTSGFNVSSSIDGAEHGHSSNFSLFATASNGGNTSNLSAVNSINLGTAAGAQLAIVVCDGALDQISSVRANLGAVQSRFQSAIDNIGSSIDNLSSARSRILDADFAAETADLTKNQILQQAGTTILAQANHLPEGVLALLQ